MVFWNTKGLRFSNKNRSFPILRYLWMILSTSSKHHCLLLQLHTYCNSKPSNCSHQVHSNELGNLYCSWCQGQFNPFWTPYSIINHLYVETNNITKMWKENSPHFNQTWGDLMDAKLKFPSWSSYWKSFLF